MMLGSPSERLPKASSSSGSSRSPAAVSAAVRTSGLGSLPDDLEQCAAALLSLKGPESADEPDPFAGVERAPEALGKGDRTVARPTGGECPQLQTARPGKLAAQSRNQGSSFSRRREQLANRGLVRHLQHPADETLLIERAQGQRCSRSHIRRLLWTTCRYQRGFASAHPQEADRDRSPLPNQRRGVGLKQLHQPSSLVRQADPAAEIDCRRPHRLDPHLRDRRRLHQPGAPQPVPESGRSGRALPGRRHGPRDRDPAKDGRSSSTLPAVACGRADGPPTSLPPVSSRSDEVVDQPGHGARLEPAHRGRDAFAEVGGSRGKARSKAGTADRSPRIAMLRAAARANLLLAVAQQLDHRGHQLAAIRASATASTAAWRTAGLGSSISGPDRLARPGPSARRAPAAAAARTRLGIRRVGASTSTASAPAQRAGKADGGGADPGVGIDRAGERSRQSLLQSQDPKGIECQSSKRRLRVGAARWISSLARSPVLRGGWRSGRPREPRARDAPAARPAARGRRQRPVGQHGARPRRLSRRYSIIRTRLAATPSRSSARGSPARISRSRIVQRHERADPRRQGPICSSASTLRMRTHQAGSPRA